MRKFYRTKKKRLPGRCPVCGTDRCTQGYVDLAVEGTKKVLEIQHYCLRSSCRAIFTDVYRFDRKIRRRRWEKQ